MLHIALLTCLKNVNFTAAYHLKFQQIFKRNVKLKYSQGNYLYLTWYLVSMILGDFSL